MSDVSVANVPVMSLGSAKKAAGMIGIIITDPKILSIGIVNAKKTADKLAVQWAALAVSTMWHACKHGDPAKMNTFYGTLPETGKAGFKRWIVKVARMVYDADTPDSNLFIGMKKDMFFIRKDTVDKREAMRVELETAAQGEHALEFGMFMAINPDKTPKPFDDKKVASMLHALLKKAEGESSEVSDDTYRALKLAVLTFDKVAPASATIN